MVTASNPSAAISRRVDSSSDRLRNSPQKAMHEDLMESVGCGNPAKSVCG